MCYRLIFIVQSHTISDALQISSTLAPNMGAALGKGLPNALLTIWLEPTVYHRVCVNERAALLCAEFKSRRD